MVTIEFDDVAITLKPQKRPAFESITAMVFEDLDGQESTGALYGRQVNQLRARGHGDLDPVVQAALWSMHDLGVRTVRSREDGSVDVLEQVDTPFLDQDLSSYAFASVRDGRAFAAAIDNVRGRTIRFNGEERPVGRHPQETVQAVMNMIASNRLVDEDLLVTTVRVIVALREQPPSPEMDGNIAAAIELASDLGIEQLAIEPDGSVEIGRLNIANALASAVLQGLDASDVKSIRTRLETLNAQGHDAS